MLCRRLTQVRGLRKQSEAASLRLANRVQYLAREEQRAVRSLSLFRAKTQFICDVKLRAVQHRAELRHSKQTQSRLEQKQREANCSFHSQHEEAIGLVHKFMQCGRRNEGRAMRVLRDVLGARRREAARKDLETLQQRVRAVRMQREGARLSPELLRQEKRDWAQSCRRQISDSEDSLLQTYSLDTDLSLLQPM